MDAARCTLADLPIVDKRQVMEHFDDWVTDRDLRLRDLEAHLESPSGPLFRGRYHVVATGGTTGERGILPYGAEEWRHVLAGILRLNRFTGTPAIALPRYRMATILGDDQMHVTYQIARSFDVGIVRGLRLPSTLGLQALCDALNRFQPQHLTTYPSMLALLASSQVEGRLQIRPGIVVSCAELLSPQVVDRVVRAWGTRPFDYYGMSEIPTVAIQCRERAYHVCEDTCILEVLGPRDQPAGPGEEGQVVVTNLWSRTLPLLRYRTTDRVVAASDTGTCPCGRTFRRLEGIQGRASDVILLPGRDGGQVPLLPIPLSTLVLGVSAVQEYKVTWDGQRLTIRFACAPERADQAKELLRRAFQSRFDEMGIGPLGLDLVQVGSLERTRGSGKQARVESRSPTET